MYRFNNDNIITGYIKQLLHSFNLPRCKVFNSAKELLEYYPPQVSCFAIVKKYKNNSDCIVYLDKGNIEVRSYYAFGKYYQNLTTKLNLFNALYDSDCHKYLGNYLRFLRDYKDINLMSLYNCFSNIILIDGSYKYLVIPVKHKKDYTVAFDGTNYKYVFTYKNNIEDIKNIFNDPKNPEYKSVVTYSSKFKVPFLLNSGIGKNTVIDTGPRAGKTIYSCFKEDNYKLVIQVKLNSNDIISVLEGNFVNNNSDYTPIQANYDKTLEDKNYDKVNLDTYISNLQLLDYHLGQSNVNYPFADRLLEYLTDMVILPKDRISNNIIEAKYKVLERYDNIPRTTIPKLNSSFTNIDRLRFLDAFSKTKYQNKNTYDLLGYVDKEIEQCLDDETRIPKEDD